MKKKKVLLFSDCYLFGGSEYVVVNILKNEYIQENYDISFAYRKHKLYRDSLKHIFPNEFFLSFFSLCLLSNTNIYYWFSREVKKRFWRRFLILPFWIIEVLRIYEFVNWILFYRLLKKIKPDLIHINNGGYPAAKTCLQLARIAHRLGFKVIMQVNNIAEIAATKNEKRVDEKVDLAVSCFVTASCYAKKMLVENRGFRVEKIETIHNAVEVASINKSRGQILECLGLPQDRIILVEVALLQYRKGQRFLLETLVHLRDTEPLLFGNITLLLIGTGEEEKYLRNYVRMHDLQNSVLLLGYRFDYIDYVNAADILLLPSIKDEDMPLIVLSAMSLGKAIISTTIAGIPEEIEDGVSGYLLNPIVENSMFVDALGKSISKAFLNKDLLGKNARERFYSNFSIEKYAREVDSLYSKYCS